jgi:tyrosyl-tRNA synthetase
MAGRHLQRALGDRALVAVCTPLLIGTDGNLKMSKSVGHSINLDLTPAEMYGKLMSIPDSLIVNYYTLLTEVSTEELRAIERGLADRSLNPMETKKRLAHSVVALLNDAPTADAAQSEFERVFQRREQPGEAQELGLALGADGTAEFDITQLLSQQGLAASRGEARRLLQQGAIALDEVKVADAKVTLKEGAILRIGPHRFYRIVAGG